MAPGDGSSTARDERRADMRDRLLAAVETPLAEGEGFAALSVDRLVTAGGVGRSTFYKYFDDKGDLLRAWFELVSDQIAGASSAWLEIAGAPQKPELRDALAQIVTTYRPYVPLMATVYDAASYDTAVGASVADSTAASEAALRAHIQRGQEEGWIDTELLPAPTASWLNWLTLRGQHQLVRSADDPELAHLIDALTDIVWNTLYAFAPARTDGGEGQA